MLNVKELYPEDNEYLKDIWDKHPFFDPSLFHIRRKDVVKAIEEGQASYYFINQVRNSFIPEKDNATVQIIFVDSMNKGIKAVNELLSINFDKETSAFLKLEEIKLPFNFSKFMREARDDFIKSRSGKRPSNLNYEKLLKAYEKMRAFGLGYRILLIDESPEVLSCLSHHHLILKWFNDQFKFSNSKKIENIEDLTHVFETKAGVNIYGKEKNPISSRLKILDENGSLSYGSILMKMFLKGQFPDDINDHVRIEFIVENEKERENLVRYFRKEIRAMERLENFEEIKEGKKSDNEQSAVGFDSVKFTIRPPIPTQRAKDSIFENLKFERIPVEVQILTLKAHEQRIKNPEIEHKAYKERQFRRFFPALFPKEIYEKLIEANSL